MAIGGNAWPLLARSGSQITFSECACSSKGSSSTGSRRRDECAGWMAELELEREREESKVQRREKKGKKLLARIGGRVEGQEFAKKNPLGAPF